MTVVVPLRFEGKTSDGQLVVIRPARQQDSRIIVENINAICQEEVFLHTAHFVATHDWIMALKQDDIDGAVRLLVVVEVQGRVVGHGRVFPSGYGHRDRHVGDVGLALLEPYRQKRIGTQVLRYLIAQAKERKLEKLTATIISDNLGATHLFARHGFQQEGIRRRQLEIKGVYCDEVCVARFLDDD